MERERVLSIRDLEISFDTVHGKAAAIRGMRFDLYRGETVAIVGESGSGKSVTMKAVMGIISNNQHIDHGSIHYSWWDENGHRQRILPRCARGTYAAKYADAIFPWCSRIP